MSGAFLCEEIMRNDLLKQIVVAAGGAVTDPNNRNELLKDWVNALSGQAGRWYFSGNGVDQRIDFASDQVFSGDFWIEAYVNMNSNGFHLASKGDNNRIAFTSNGSLVVTASGVQATSSANSGILDNNVHKLRITRSSSGLYQYSIDDVLQVQTVQVSDDLVLSSLLNKLGGFTNIPAFAGRVYNYSDSLGNALPLDDSFANNPTARSTGSGANGTYINATEASWSFE